MKQKILYLVGALAIVGARFICAQTPPPKLDLETIATIPLDERSKLLSALPAGEREKFFQRFLDLPEGGPSNAKINALFMAWAAFDPEGALADAKKLPSLDARRAGIEAICYGMKSEQASAVTHALKDLPNESLTPEQKERFLGIGLVKWSQVDPKGAADFLAQLYPDASKRLLKPGAGDGVLLTTAKGVATNWGAMEPLVALEWLNKTWPENPVAMQSAVVGWWRKDSKAAADYVKAHTSTPNEREVAGLMSGAMAEIDPRLGAQWVEWMKDDRLRERTRIAIADLWAARAPKDASMWAEGLTGKNGAGATTIVARNWTLSDAKAAEHWIDSLKDGKRDAAIRGYATTMARANPEAALTRVVEMQDAKGKIFLAKAIVTEWVTHSPEKAAAWLKKSQFPAAQKKELLEQAKRAE